MNESFNEFVDSVKSGKIKNPETGVDGSYSHPGRNSPTCGSSLVATFPDSYKIIGYEITKRAQEADPKSKFRGDVRWDLTAQELEGENCRKLLNSQLKSLATQFSFSLSMDQDCKVKKLVNQVTKNWPNEVKVLFDAAHTIKNIRNNSQAIIKDHSFWGDSVGRIGFNNFYRFVRGATVTVKLLCKLRREKGIEKAEIKQKMLAFKAHSAGFHYHCEHKDKCKKEPTIKYYPNKFSRKQVHQLLTGLFDNYLCSEDFIDAIYNCGVTSPNEFFHSILTNRRLVVKGENVNVLSLSYDASYCLGILFFNLGEVGTFQRLFDYFGLTLNDQSLKNFESNEKMAVLRREKNLKLAPVIRENRKKNQKQNQSKAKDRLNYVYLNAQETYELEKKNLKNITVRKPRKNAQNSPSLHPNITDRKRKRT